MHIFSWFGWSTLWLTPLVWRLFRKLFAAGAERQSRGAIRLWLGTAVILCASSALEGMLHNTDGAVAQGDLFGHALATGLSDRFGRLSAAILSLVFAVAALPWVFRLGRRQDPQAPAQRADSGPKTNTSISAANASTGAAKFDSKPVMATPSNTVGARIGDRDRYRNNDRNNAAAAPRRAESWKLPSSIEKKASAHNNWPSARQPSKTSAAHTQPTRPETEWASFESLRPTGPMLARARATAHTQPANTPPLATRTIIRGTTPSEVGVRPPKRIVMPLAGSDLPGAPVNPVAPPSPMHNPITPAAAAAPAVSAIQNLVAEPLLAATPVPAAAAATADIRATVLPVTASAAAAHELMEYQQEIAPTVPTAPVAAITPPIASTITPPIAALIAPPISAAPTPLQFRAPPISPTPPSLPSPLSLFNDDDLMLPSLDLLDAGHDAPIELSAEQLAETGQLIEQRLKEFKVPVTVLGAYSGPVITRYEIEPALGVRGAQIVNLMKDLSRALGLSSIRVVETIPGKTCMGLELPNARRQMIRLAEIFESAAYRNAESGLTLAMGKDITGEPVVTDLGRAPHMLVAGTTGSGKSVAINAMILSLLYKSTPEQVRLIMIDPKMLELSVYDGIPHLLAPVVTDMRLAGNALTWCVGEMDKRYRLMSALGVRNLAGYNQKIRDGISAEKFVKNPFSLTPDAPEPLSTLPMIVVIIDELADLMMVTGKKIEELIARLAQKARAAGIHLILATQRPSVDVITGLIKANIPTRVAFQVSSKIDSRTVLDQMGAEALLGHGDMLFLPPGSGYPQRVHGAFVSDQEVHRVVEYLKSFGEPDYEEAILAGPAVEEGPVDLFGAAPDPEADPLYDEAVAFVVRSRRASISSVQRQFRVGYNRAARLVEQMEAAGILSAMATNGSRDVLTPPMVE